MQYGDKRDYPKIDIYIGGKYAGSTTWAKTCKEAMQRFRTSNCLLRSNPVAGAITAHFSKER